jgi:hypothetical protein
MGGALRGALGWYTARLQEKPLLTKTVTGFAMALAGDLVAQRSERPGQPWTSAAGGLDRLRRGLDRPRQSPLAALGGAAAQPGHQAAGSARASQSPARSF